MPLCVHLDISKRDFSFSITASNCLKNVCVDYFYQAIGLISRVFANDPGDQGSMPGRVIPKTQKMVFDAALFNTQNYKLRIKGKVEQSREWSRALSYTSVY